jgi:glycosyltransferase involved in cell wall biosynthesis
MKKITVVTSTFNIGEQNIPSIQSILNQTCQDFQYIVVNDGSADSTQRLLDAIEHPNLTILHQENRGFTNTLADVLEDLQTPYVAIHDAGDISYPHRFEEQLNLIESDPALGAVGCHVRNLYQDGRLLHVKIDPTYLENPLPELIKENYFSHGEVLFRYSAYLKAGGYRRFFKYAQDRDLWLRMAEFCSFAKVDKFLYDRVIIPCKSIGSDFQKVEQQAQYSAFSVYLAKQKLNGFEAPSEAIAENDFLKFKATLDSSFNALLVHKILQAARNSYCQTGKYQLLRDAAERVLELDIANTSARRYLKMIDLIVFCENRGLIRLGKFFNEVMLLYLSKGLLQA